MAGSRSRTGPLAARIALVLAIAAGGPSAQAAANPSPPMQPAESAAEATHRQLTEAAGAVVSLRVKALRNARSAATLGTERTGSGVVIAPSGLVLTIGYLILEADQVEVTDAKGRTVPATVAAYDHATGFGLVRPFAPLAPKPIRLGTSRSVESGDRVLVATTGEAGLSVATVVARRPFAGYWEYLIEGALFTAPPRIDHSGAALINKDGELVGIGSLLVMDALKPGERFPGNMFVPVELLEPILAEMIATGRQKAGRRPWLGVNAMEDDGRLRVLRVTEESPADEAGLKPGDVILGLGGVPVKDLEAFYRALWGAGSPGVEVTLRVLQEGEVRQIRVKSMDRLDFVRRKPTI
ncbi:MAG: serine protease [Betaproteobacteria bacterium]|nr:serine protease [Betaproteobacteria bacterium]